MLGSLQGKAAHRAMAAVAMCVWMRSGALCASVQLDTSSLPVELFVKVCNILDTQKHWFLEGFNFRIYW